MPRVSKKPRIDGKDTTSQLHRDSQGDPDCYKAAITDRLEKTSDLSAELLRKRIRAVEIRSQQNELILAKARDQLILKDLVEKQAAYLVVCMRQRMLQIPHTWARRILNLTEVREAREILREMVIGALKELASLPMKVIDPNWLDTLEGNGSPSETVEAGKASGSKSMARIAVLR